MKVKKHIVNNQTVEFLSIYNIDTKKISGGDMSKRKRKNSVILEELLNLVFELIIFIVIVVFRIILFIFDLITFNTSQYKIKSNNSFLKTFFNKGNYGEFILYRKIIKVFGKNSVLTNLYLDNKNTDTTEIDVLAISNKGIYVFEMKNYAGHIYGSEQDNHWTQVLNFRTKNKFYNPLKQNYAHSKAIENYLELTFEDIIPVVVFSNRSKLRKVNLRSDQNVIQLNRVLKFIKKQEKSLKDVFTLDSKEKMLLKLIKKCHMDDEIKQLHIQQVKDLREKI